MYEGKHLPLASVRTFVKRIIYSLVIGFSIIALSLCMGMTGYIYFENMDIVSAYENAAMILSGMGPVDNIVTTGGKLFAGSYALFSGVIFLLVIAIILAPVFHRFFHWFLLKESK